MCCETETTQETSTKLPDYVENASKLLVNKATGLAEKPVTLPKLEIAGFNADQQLAFQQTRDLANKAPIATERVVDENGRLGSVGDYFNKYRSAALDPAMRAVDDTAAQQRKRITAGAQSAESFGDARHGLLEANVDTAQQQTKGDLVKTGSADAFDKAMAARQIDASRFTDVDKTNFSNALQSIQALLATGGEQQGNEQAEHKSVFDQFMAQYGHDFDVLSALGTALGRTPYEQSSTTTSTAPDNSILSTLGGVAGKIGSSAPVAAAIASFL